MSRLRRRFDDLQPDGRGLDEALIGTRPLLVGWLRYHRTSYPKGAVPAPFVSRLRQFCHADYAVHPVRSISPCPICGQMVADEVDEDGRVYKVGFYEIRVIGTDEIFAAPSLIYHYVTAHQYQPPRPFIDAVLHGPAPTSAEYRALMRALQA